MQSFSSIENKQPRLDLPSSKASQLNVLPALSGLFSFLFERISDRFLGFLVLVISLSLVVFTANRFTPLIHESISTLEAMNLPFHTATIQSEGSKQLSKESLVLSMKTAPIPQNLKIEKTLQVFATSYDKYCKGCNDITATGMKAGYGVVAVDPKVIALGSKLYIPGYGFALAGDTGGKVKGNKVDLGFENVKNGWWSARFVEIYVLR